MMTMCICLRIPLFVVGKPGSSKSLGKTIVKNNMKGKNSKGSSFKKLPDTQMLSFQCSPWSTSKGIEKLFQQGAKLQIDKADPENYIAVVVLDELGLAEDTPQMSLKILHSLLEDGVQVKVGCENQQKLVHQRVGFIGISNWALDPAKMNRGLFVLRDVPTREDLTQTAKDICKETSLQTSAHLLDLTNFFHQLFNEDKSKREYFGLRDYFSAVKHLAQKARDTRAELTHSDVAHCLLRNFSGFEDFSPTQFFFSEILHEPEISVESHSVVVDALKATGPDQRHLLLITENASGFKVLKRLLNDPDLLIVFGSSFPKDQEYSKICLNINRIKQCMEKGSRVVLMNLENLYESLYDVLNLSYETLGQDHFVDLGLGTHRLKSKIHPNFRIFVIADDKTVDELFPIPLLNRLEKHHLSWRTILEPEMLEFCKGFQEWISQFLSHEERRNCRLSALSWCFVGYHDDVIPSLAIDENCQEEGVRRRILSTATPDSLIRLANTSLKDKKAALLNQYYEEHGLGCLAAFLNNYNLKKPFLQVTTYDCILSTNQQHALAKMSCFKDARYKNISQFETELQFKDFIKQNMNGEGLLILQYEGLQQNLNFQSVVESVKFIIEDTYLADLANTSQVSDARRTASSLEVIFIIKLIRSHSNLFTGLDCGLWHCVHIEELVASNRINIPMLDRLTIPKLFDRPVFEPTANNQDLMLGIREPVNVTLLLKGTLLPALSILMDKHTKEDKLADRNDTVSTALRDEKFLQTIGGFMHKVLTTMDDKTVSTIPPQEWLSSDAASSKKVKEAGTFIESTWRVLKRRTAPALASFLAFADIDENLANYRREETRDLWLKLAPHAARLDDTMEGFVNVGPIERVRIEVPRSAVDGHCFAALFPFSWAIVRRLEKLTDRSVGGSTTWSLHTSILDTDMGRILANEKNSDSLLADFCHDVLHICVDSITEKEVKVLQTVLLKTVKCSFKGETRENSLADLIFLTFQTLKKYIEPVKILVRLTQRISGLTANMKGIEKIQDLPLEIFKAYAKHFENVRHDLNKAATRKDWLAKVDKSRTIIARLLSQLNCPPMQLQWDKISCVALFLRNVTSQFDNEGLSESTIKPIRLWTSLWSSEEVNFQAKSGIEEVEKFLDKMREELTDIAVGAYVCSQCGDRAENLTRLPCNDSLCEKCAAQCMRSDGPSSCIKCQNQFDASLLKTEKPETLVKFKSRCNSFIMEVVSTLCFQKCQPPEPELCNHLLSYVTRKGAANVIGYFDDDKEKSPMFRSFILQQLMRYNSDEVVNHLEQHILGADEEVGAGSKNELRLIVLNCLEDATIIEMARNSASNLSVQVLPGVSDSMENIRIPQLQAIARWRVHLSRLACCYATMETNDARDTRHIRNLLDSAQDLTILLKTFRESRWSRIYFLRCLCMEVGTCATLKRIQTDPDLKDAYQEELQQMDAGTWIPDLLFSHSEAYRELKNYLWQMYITGKFKHNKPEAIKTDNIITALVVATFNYHLQSEVNKSRLKECILHMEKLMQPDTKNCYTHLRAVSKDAVQTCQPHQSILLLHLAFEIFKSKEPSEYVAFFRLLAQNYKEWFLPAMEHDKLYEIMTTAGIDAPTPGAFKCPKGHIYFVGECGQPMETSECPDCGSTIGGKHHTPETGNENYISEDKTKKGIVPPGASEPVRQLPGSGVALIRMMMGLALQLRDSSVVSPSSNSYEDGRAEFEVGLLIFCDSTGRSAEDAFHVLHLVLAQLNSAKKQRRNKPFALNTDSDRRQFETRMYRDLLQPIVESLSAKLRESKKILSEDDTDRTVSNIMRLVHETTEVPSENAGVALLWRYRQPITVRNAAQSFKELGRAERNEYKLVEEVIALEPVLKHVRHLPVLVKLARELVAEWKHNRELKTTKQLKLQNLCLHNTRRVEAVETFVRVWNDLHEFLADRTAKFQNGKTWIAFPVENFRMTAKVSKTPLAAVLPHRNPWGHCIVALVQLLVASHNAVINACENCEPDEIELEAVDTASVIVCDPEIDLLPMLLANSSYSLKPGDSASAEVTYNFLGLQQQLRERLVRGRSRICGYLPEMVYNEDFNLMEIFKQLDRAGVRQEVAFNDTALENALRCNLPTPILTALLDDSLKVVINFLISLAPSNPGQLLDDFMCKTLRMDTGLPTDALKRNVTISQTRLLWMSLDHLRWRQLAQDGFEPFEIEWAEPLSQEHLQELPNGLRNRRSLLLEKLHRLIRLELRSLPTSVRELPLKDMAEIDPAAYETVFQDLPPWLVGKHACRLWSVVFAWANE